MKTKLWQSNDTSSLHPVIERYTVGNDTVYDQKLLGYDIAASKAHAAMLGKTGLIKAREAKQLVEGLDTLLAAWSAGKFVLDSSYEDGHSAIEAHLIKALGQTGKKIHTGRSRNDQALVMMRLYLKDNLGKLSSQVNELSGAFTTAAQKYGDIPMPGYTHMQKAMPTSVGLWLGAYADGLGDANTLLQSTTGIIDQNPLGSSAGFGSSLAIDREFTTTELDFAKTQQNPLYCGVSRGIFELLAVQSIQPLMVLAGKFAADMMLFTTQEFGFFSLPARFTTGSSIMPHKQNYDLFEIMRGKAHAFSAYSLQLHALASGIGSGYHRDLQLTKQPVVDAFDCVNDTLQVLLAVVPQLIVHQNVLASSITTEMHSVEVIDKLVAAGVPFRDAYKQVKESLHD